ncbi:MAG: YceI family protein [Acidimicrobiales bacterium]
MTTTSRFELAPPRRFVLPAILLLLSERPGHGYDLASRLEELHFGHVDRPAIYRALAQLERDGLVEDAGAAPGRGVGPSRRVHQITAGGERVLREWMGVVREEHAGLGEVLRRYQATGTAESVLAEASGGWTVLGTGWSGPRRRLVSLETDARPAGEGAPEPGPPTRFALDPDRSAVLLEVRSSVGPLSFGAVGVSGWLEAVVAGGQVHAGPPAPEGELVVELAALRSGNSLYDAELLRRVDARRYPTATVRLGGCAATGLGSRYNLDGELTFHGVSRPVKGAVSVEPAAGGRLVVTGEQVFDIRDFGLPSPTVLMLRLYPDVRVRLQLEASPAGGGG